MAIEEDEGKKEKSIFCFQNITKKKISLIFVICAKGFADF